jgi:hypothetical protein
MKLSIIFDIYKLIVQKCYSDVLNERLLSTLFICSLCCVFILMCVEFATLHKPKHINIGE